MRERKRVAVVSSTQVEENRHLLQGIGRYKTMGKDWNIYIDSSYKSISDPEWLFKTEWDGIIFNHHDRDLPVMCRERGIPCVDTNDESPALAGIPKIRSDNVSIGALAAEYLEKLGFRTFAYCGYANDETSSDRLAGFQGRLSGACHETRSFERIRRANHAGDRLEPNPCWEDAEIEEMAEWIPFLPVPTAIFACDDRLSSKVEKACQAIGIMLPNEVGILGVNNETFVCELSQTPLSSIDPNAITRGVIAAECLQDLFGGRSPQLAETLVPPREVVSRQSTNCDAVSDELVARALRVIRDHVCEGLRVDDLARMAKIPRRLLERRFRAHLGKSPNVAIREAQVAEIKRLLTYTDKPLTEIAYDTGFENPEYMHVVFKREEGITPGSYRQRHVALI